MEGRDAMSLYRNLSMFPCGYCAVHRHLRLVEIEPLRWIALTVVGLKDSDSEPGAMQMMDDGCTRTVFSRGIHACQITTATTSATAGGTIESETPRRGGAHRHGHGRRGSRVQAELRMSERRIA
jgi:hypothetical protein